MQYFNIQMASQLSGVASATIRAWEKRYQAVTPHRAENKHRLYSEKDIEKLSLLAKITDYGQNIGKIARLDLEELKNIYSTLMKKPYQQVDFITAKEKLNLDKFLTSLTLAISSFKMDIIAHELTKVRQSVAAREVALKVLAPLKKIIESKLAKGDIFEGHLLALNQMIFFHFSPFIADYDYSSTETPPLIMASPDKIPSLDLLAVALLCTHYRRNFLYLGTGLTAKTLAEIINHNEGDSLLLEAQDYELDELNLDQYLDQLNRSLRYSPRLYINGPLVLEQHTTRKNCLFLHHLAEVDQMLAAGKM